MRRRKCRIIQNDPRPPSGHFDFVLVLHPVRRDRKREKVKFGEKYLWMHGSPPHRLKVSAHEKLHKRNDYAWIEFTFTLCWGFGNLGGQLNVGQRQTICVVARGISICTVGHPRLSMTLQK